MNNLNFITVRLGKDSISDINRISSSEVGVLAIPLVITVKCTQVPDNYRIGDYAFIWLGSDNNKGMQTKWKMGFKAVGKVKEIKRGASYNDISENVISILYVFKNAVNKLDVLRCAPFAYYWFSSFPVIGPDDHANQTIRSMSGEVFSDIRAFFCALNCVVEGFRKDIVKVEPRFDDLFDITIPSPKDYPSARALSDVEDNLLARKVLIFQTESINQFAYDVFRVLEDRDKMKSLEALAIESKANFTNNAPLIAFQSKKNNERLTNVFIISDQQPTQTYYFDKSFNFNGRKAYLNNGWASDDANRPDLTLRKLSIIVNECYGDILEIVKVNHSYQLRYKGQNRKYPHQQIFYGAPGTGKSNTIKINTAKAEDEERVYRTTFHPDSDYSTFVGCYKPSMKPTGEIMASGVKKEVITYKFVPQAFARAYVKAWSQEENVYLIIEEINRGNCAQIFGDLFQLLDRKNGVSEYPIDADTDFADYIREELGKNSKRTDFPKGVKEGKKLVLPSNLYIWATMNTSDQSLFPIDSAFKRRWEWVYIPIKNHREEDYKIEIGGYKYNWWLFLEKINIVIGNTTSSEDKKLGYFFAKADGKIISAKQFVGKVLFYLWNDVFKNYAFDNAIFDKGNNKKFVFSDFFLADGEPDPDSMNAFMKKLDETITLENKASMILVKPEPAKENQANTEEPSATEEPADTEA